MYPWSFTDSVSRIISNLSTRLSSTASAIRTGPLVLHADPQMGAAQRPPEERLLPPESVAGIGPRVSIPLRYLVTF